MLIVAEVKPSNSFWDHSLHGMDLQDLYPCAPEITALLRHYRLRHNHSEFLSSYMPITLAPTIPGIPSKHICQRNNQQISQHQMSFLSIVNFAVLVSRLKKITSNMLEFILVKIKLCTVPLKTDFYTNVYGTFASHRSEKTHRTFFKSFLSTHCA